MVSDVLSDSFYRSQSLPNNLLESSLIQQYPQDQNDKLNDESLGDEEIQGLYENIRHIYAKSVHPCTLLDDEFANANSSLKNIHGRIFFNRATLSSQT